jgi:hypothetical protein
MCSAKSASSAEGLYRENVNDISELTSVTNEVGVLNKPNLAHNIDETDCVLNNVQHLNILAETGFKMFAERSTVVVCCSDSGKCISNMTIYKGKKSTKNEWMNFHTYHRLHVCAWLSQCRYLPQVVKAFQNTYSYRTTYSSSRRSFITRISSCIGVQ